MTQPSPTLFTFSIYTGSVLVYNHHINATTAKQARIKLGAILKRRYPIRWRYIRVIPVEVNLPERPMYALIGADSFAVKMFAEGVMEMNERPERKNTRKPVAI